MGHNSTVVVVDDEPEILDIIGEVLDDDGFRVVCLQQPGHAAEAVRDAQPALYLLDLMMPGMNGIQLAKEIRGSDPDHTPILAMSASPEMLRQARASGLFDDLLPKPFDLSELVDRVELHAC